MKDHINEEMKKYVIGKKYVVYDPRTLNWKRPIQTTYTLLKESKGVATLYRTRQDSRCLYDVLLSILLNPEYTQIRILGDDEIDEDEN